MIKTAAQQIAESRKKIIEAGSRTVRIAGILKSDDGDLADTFGASTDEELDAWMQENDKVGEGNVDANLEGGLVPTHGQELWALVLGNDYGQDDITISATRPADPAPQETDDDGYPSDDGERPPEIIKVTWVGA